MSSPSAPACRFRSARILSAQLLALLLAGCALPVPPSAAQPATAVQPAQTLPPLHAVERGVARAWAHESSDLPVNPRVRFGRLDNGLRFAWMLNSEPRERSSLRLHIDIGSLVEQDHEQGLAHFLEHMAFNGSEHFDAGTMVELFQRLGMAFGADTNASTSFDETIYQLDLPVSDADTLREGLRFLRDVAAGLLLDPGEIAAEIGVIDGEQRERDSAGFRAGVAELRDLFAGTRVAERIPIGVSAVRAAFDEPIVRGFYERWYRPENMTLILVGDLGELDPEPLFREAFEGIHPREGAPAARPDTGRPTLGTRSFAWREAEVPVVSLRVQRLVAAEDVRDSRAERVADLALSFARRMLNLRLSELAREESAPFLAASLSATGGFQLLDGEQLSITARPELWQAALAAGEQELRRALQHGFRAAELEEVRRRSLSALDEAVQREATRSSGAFTAELLTAANSRLVPTTAAVEREILRPALEALTPEACQAALVEAWEQGGLRLSAVGSLPEGADVAAQLLEVWQTSAATEVQAPPELLEQEWAYASDPSAATAPIERREEADLGLTLARFGNGVLLNVKPTDFRDRQVLVRVRIGNGLLDWPAEDVPVGFVASRSFELMGLGQHDIDELRRLLAGRQVDLDFGVSEDAFVFSGTTTPEDLPLLLELITAYVRDPGWRPEALVPLARQLDPLFESLAQRPDGPLQTRFLRALHGGDARFGLPTRAELDAVDAGRIRALLAPVLASGSVQVTIVGEVEVEAALAATAASLGTLPARSVAQPDADRRFIVPASGLREEATVPTQLPQALVFVALPTGDATVARDRRRLQLLGQIVSDRLRLEVRERLGAAYSPSAGAQASRIYPGLSWLQLTAFAEPGQAADVLAACLAVLETLRDEGVTEDELVRQREPLLAQLRDGLRQNGFWLSTLEEAQTRASALDEIREVETDYRSILPEELSELAATLLSTERINWMLVRPEAVAATEPEEP